VVTGRRRRRVGLFVSNREMERSVRHRLKKVFPDYKSRNEYLWEKGKASVEIDDCQG